ATKSLVGLMPGCLRIILLLPLLYHSFKSNFARFYGSIYLFGKEVRKLKTIDPNHLQRDISCSHYLLKAIFYKKDYKINHFRKALPLSRL
ncbi:hypothetical protein SP7UMMC_06504, partial [Streptococcus pneumoniae MNZ85]|uniref:hypothetical protein n=1 Tax=Streptococcus pneumoniae TaxID=1313 RepID=UPI000353D4F4